MSSLKFDYYCNVAGGVAKETGKTLCLVAAVLTIPAAMIAYMAYQANGLVGSVIGHTFRLFNFG